MKTQMLLRLFAAGGFLAATAQLPIHADALTGEITLQLHGFDYASGVGTSRSNFLERYHTRRDWISGSTRSGVFMDIDLDLQYRAPNDAVITVDRWGDGHYRQGGRAAYDTDRYQLSAKYDYLRTATGGLDFLYSAHLVPGGTDPSYFFPARTNTASGYAAQFNNTTDRQIFNLNRFAYGLGFMIKPGVLGDLTRITLDWDGYVRTGHRFVAFVFGGGDVIPTEDRALQRWRGVSQRVDENNNRLSLNVVASPGYHFDLVYRGSYEWFNNRAPRMRFADVPLPPPYTIAEANRIRPVGHIPDSTLINHDLRVSRTFDQTRVSVGGNMSKLQQDSFTLQQIALGWDRGRIDTKGAFVNVDSSLTNTFGVRGFMRYGERTNKSSYPVEGLFGSSRTNLGVRLNKIESLRYGLSLTTRPRGARSSLEFGWRAEDKDRDLTFNDQGGLIPSVSLLQGTPRTDELFTRGSFRISDSLIFRGGLSYAWANKTGLVTEPGKALGLRTALVYTSPDGGLLSFYYHLRDTENDNNAFRDKLVDNPTEHFQNIETKMQSAGVSYDFKPAPEVDARFSLNWTNQDASVRYYETNRRRYEANPVIFSLRDVTGSKIDVFVLEVSANWQVSEQMSFDGAYYLTHTKGNLASGEVARELSQIDNSLDNALHSFIVGMNHRLTRNTRYRVSYAFDDYSDRSYSLLSASAHSVLFAFTWDL